MLELVFLWTGSLFLGGVVVLTIIANFLESLNDRRRRG